MNRGRSRLEIGDYGDIHVQTTASGSYRAEARYRDWDGVVRKVAATGASRAAAKASLRRKLNDRAENAGLGASLNQESSLRDLADEWLADVQARDDLAESTKDLYRRELGSLVLPTFGDFRLREVTTGRVDHFLRRQAAVSSAHARHSRVVLNLMFNFALRRDAVTRNPVAGTARLTREKKLPKALTPEEISLIRAAARTWRTGTSVHGPRPDNRVPDLIEVMLGTGQRIGEALALRRCDVDLTIDPVQVTVSGTLIVIKGKPAYRQSHPKSAASQRTIAVPGWTAEVLRRRIAQMADGPGEQFIFQTRNGTPLTPYNARRTLRNILASAGLTDLHITPHSFRRTGATAIAWASDAESAAGFLGHTSADITRAHYIQAPVESVNVALAGYLETLAPQRTEPAAR
ncbi:MAG: tyrosine-type recombinase/integrase [Acidobacteria bacterium]|nr:tyrosine-type recombinase/integrase [Acidobacteriota bacterium]